MKADIHPTYHPQATIHCACGNQWQAGSTKSELNVAICSNCHPFYTGNDKIVDTRGRVEKFKKRLEKSSSLATVPRVKKPRAKKQS